MLLNLTRPAFKTTNFRSSVKESSLSRSIRSAIHAAIHPLILVSVIAFRCSQNCLSVWDWRLVGDYGKMPHLFVRLHLVLLFVQRFSHFLSVEVCVWNPCEGVCTVYVSARWILITVFVCERCYHSTHPPLQWYFPPSPHICSCVFAIAASCSQPPHFLFFTLGGTQDKGEKVAQFPP